MGGVQVSAKLDGVDRIMRRFENLKRQTQRSIVRKATRSGLAPMRTAARGTSKFQDRTGKLRKSFRLSVMNSKRDRGAILGRVLAGRRGSGVAYATPLEYGHRIAVDPSTRAAAKHFVFFTNPNGTARKVKPIHKRAADGGRVAPRWYMRTAFEQSTTAAAARFREKALAEIEVEATRG